MNKTLRRMAGATAVLTLASVGFGVSATNATRAHAACTIPSPPANDELTANPDSSVSIDLVGSAGATSYNIYRGTASGGEAGTPVAAIAGDRASTPPPSPATGLVLETTGASRSGTGRTARVHARGESCLTPALRCGSMSM